MVNQGRMTESNNRASLIGRAALRMGRVFILMCVVLAFEVGSVNARPMTSPTAAEKLPDCGAPPFCRDILMRSPPAILFDCWYQPICSKLQARKYGLTSLSNNSLSAVLKTQFRPGTYDIQLEVVSSTIARSGPGDSFYSYGELPVALVTRVVGISQHGKWWVIPLPRTIAPDGMGWVDAASVSISNVSTAPIDPPACEGLVYCGSIQAHSQPDIQFGGIDCRQQPICSVLQAHNRQNLPALLPSYTVESMLGLPINVKTGD